MYSSFSPDLGCFSLISIEEGEEALTSFHVRSDTVECADSDDANISPRRKEPKKDVVAAVQMTCFVSESQFVLAIFDPIAINKGKVTTRRVLRTGAECEIFSAPLSNWVKVKSFEI
jgi:hypothetical protein